MVIYVILHGGAHGAWCWRPLLGELDAPMLALDLPGRGRRPANLAEQTYESFLDSAEADILKHNLFNVVLVAHSMGGITAVGLMERMPNRLRQVIFVASPIPPEGMSICEFVARNLQMDESRASAQKVLSSGDANAQIGAMLYHDCSEADRAWALAHIGAESMAVYGEPVRLTGFRSDVPRAYIRTLKDRGLPPKLQDESISRLSRAQVYAMDTGHSPMLADPAGLAQLIAEITARVAAT